MTTVDPQAVEEQPTPKKMTLPELRKFDGELFIQNNTANKITFHERLGDKWVDFELDPVGEPDSVAYLPKLALDMRGLQKLWMKGAITISTDPEMEDQIMLLNAKAVGVSDARLAEMMGKQTENANHRDITELLCIAKTATGVQCGQRDPQTGVVHRGRVLQNRRQVKDGTPPLCADHQDQRHQFVPRLVSEKGEEHWEFDTVQLGTPQR